MENAPLVSVIVLSLNGEKVIAECLETLAANDYPNFETLVVNNGSTDSTAAIVREQFPGVRLLDLPANLGFAGGMNEGLRAAGGEFLILLNDDTIQTPSLVTEMVRPMIDGAAIGIVGCKILYPDRKTIQHAGGEILPNGMTRHLGYEEEDRGQFDAPADVDYVSGCAIAIRREVFEQIGLLDDRYFPIYYEETELAVRTRAAGYRVLYNPAAVLYHLESQTQGRYSSKFVYRINKGRGRFVLKNFSARQMLRALKYEALWLVRSAPRAFLAPMLAAYLVTLARAPFILYDRSHRFLPLRRS